MKKSLYAKPCFGVENPTRAQAKVIFVWAMENGAKYFESWDSDIVWKYFGVDTEGVTYFSDCKPSYYDNILTFAEFAELTGVEVVG